MGKYGAGRAGRRGLGSSKSHTPTSAEPDVTQAPKPLQIEYDTHPEARLQKEVRGIGVLLRVLA